MELSGFVTLIYGLHIYRDGYEGVAWDSHEFKLISSVQFSRSVVSDSLRPHESQYARPPCSSPTPGLHRFTSIESVIPSSHLILGRPLLLLPPIPPRNPRADLLQNGLVGSPCRPRDSQESSPTPQFKSINSSALSLLHSPTLTSIHDHKKNHSLE